MLEKIREETLRIASKLPFPLKRYKHILMFWRVLDIAEGSVMSSQTNMQSLPLANMDHIHSMKTRQREDIHNTKFHPKYQGPRHLKYVSNFIYVCKVQKSSEKRPLDPAINWR